MKPSCTCVFGLTCDGCATLNHLSMTALMALIANAQFGRKTIISFNFAETITAEVEWIPSACTGYIYRDYLYWNGLEWRSKTPIGKRVGEK